MRRVPVAPHVARPRRAGPGLVRAPLRDGGRARHLPGDEAQDEAARGRVGREEGDVRCTRVIGRGSTYAKSAGGA